MTIIIIYCTGTGSYTKRNLKIEKNIFGIFDGFFFFAFGHQFVWFFERATCVRECRDQSRAKRKQVKKSRNPVDSL